MVSSTGLADRRPKENTENWRCLFFIFKEGKGCSSVKVPSCEHGTTGHQDNFQLIHKLWKWISDITPVTLVPKVSKSTAASPQSCETGQINDDSLNVCGQQLVKSALLQWPHHGYFVSPFCFLKSCCTIVNSLCITFSVTLFVFSLSSVKPSLSLRHWGHSEKAAIFKPERELSAGTEFVGILILDISASKTVRNKCLLFKPPCSRYFVIAAWTD